MKQLTICLLALLSPASVLSADDIENFQITFGRNTVETSALSIDIRPTRDDVHFSITLHNKQSGFQRRLEFEGEGSTDPTPFQMDSMYYCNTEVIMLSVEYPWHHDLPEFQRVISTFAFRRSDFSFMDVAFGPLTDIALADDTAYEPSDLDMLPPIRVRCLTGQDEKPFEFFEQATK